MPPRAGGYFRVTKRTTTKGSNRTFVNGDRFGFVWIHCGFLDGDDAHTLYEIPAGTIIPGHGFLLLEEAQFSSGLGSGDSARLFQPDGTTLIDSYTWASHANTTYGRCPDGTGGFTTTNSPTKGTSNDCSTAATSVKINEIESSGGTPGDWVELHNTSSSAVDVSGLKFLDGADTHTPYEIDAWTIISGNGHLVLEEAQFVFGLGGGDSARRSSRMASQSSIPTPGRPTRPLLTAAVRTARANSLRPTL